MPWRLRKGLHLIPILLLASTPGCRKDDRPAAPESTEGATPAAAAGAKPTAAGSSATRPRVVVLGFDGVDPDLVDQWMASGDLPNLKALAEAGTFRPLRSTTPPQSPVAWATFASGRLPQGHGIYDFIARNPKTYLPRVATVKIRRPLVEHGKLVRGLEGTNLRQGPSFWRLAGEAGVKGSVLFVPYSFPPDGTGDMRVVSGLGTPDLRGTNSTFQYFAAGTFPLGRKAGPVSGGTFTQAEPDGEGAYTTKIRGPSAREDGSRRAIPRTLPAHLKIEKNAVRFAEGGVETVVRRGTWSKPLELTFDLVPGTPWHAVTRLYAVEGTGDAVGLYLSPLSADPRQPPFPLSTPAGFAPALAKGLGAPYKTVGWVHETSGLSTEALDEKGFLSDLMSTMDAREKILLHVLSEDHDELTVAAFTATDRVGHMLWRLVDTRSPRYDAALAAKYGDAIKKVYERMDEIVGRVVEALPKDALLLVVSDHGFHSFRRGVNLNRWLVDQGYMTLQPGATEGRDFFRDVDWSKTRAYAVGTGQIWVNLAGREGQGIVPEQDAEALREEIAKKLSGLKDGKTEAVVGVHLRDATYGHTDTAPDLTVSFAEGYRTGWGSILGGSPKALFEDNEKKWSGDHAASDPEDTKGFLVSNRKLPAEDPGIEDVAPTVLELYGVSHDGPGAPWLKR